MDAAEKRLLLQQEFGWAEPLTEGGFLIPMLQGQKFLQRLAALDIGLVSSIEVLERYADETYTESIQVQLWTHLNEFRVDRTLTLSQAASFIEQHLAPDRFLEFTYDVFDDIPQYERAAVLREKPSLSAVVSATGQVEVVGVLGIQPVMDLIWHHVRLLQVTTEEGKILELGHIAGRFEQLRQATAWMGDIWLDSPYTRFGMRGQLLEYQAPLPKNQWLLPVSLRS
ncbi:hypothetical protein [Deinococcus puniceus]|uniref:hypothetical protein n=1 Tax=Deinococcus puniceus TaxID=1182568 RepID=UPI0007C8D765|nr:hypothetical protein [Deinococcus puniceus]